jgi:hypothetical protein
MAAQGWIGLNLLPLGAGLPLPRDAGAAACGAECTGANRRTRGLKGRAAIDFLRERGVQVEDEVARAANGGQPQQRRAPQARERLIATYDYTDEFGALVYQVCRYESAQATGDGKREKRFSRGDCAIRQRAQIQIGACALIGEITGWVKVLQRGW